MNPSTLIQLFGFQRWYLSALVDDVADARFADQFGPVVNHPAWQTGHLAVVMDLAAQLLGEKAILDASWKRRFDRGTTPTPRRADYPGKAELLATLDERRAAVVSTCESLGDEDWNKPHGIAGIDQFLPGLLGCMHLLMISHESNHLGQLATWRRAAGLPMALSAREPVTANAV